MWIFRFIYQEPFFRDIEQEKIENWEFSALESERSITLGAV